MGQKHSLSDKKIMLCPEFCVYDVRVVRGGGLEGTEFNNAVEIWGKKKYVSNHSYYRVYNPATGKSKMISCVGNKVCRPYKSMYYKGELHIPLLDEGMSLETGPEYSVYITHVNDRELPSHIEIQQWLNPISDHMPLVKEKRLQAEALQSEDQPQPPSQYPSWVRRGKTSEV